jgi:serine/threonine-protein kinase
MEYLADHSRVGSWLIEGEVGHGGMSTVYLAKHETTGERAAVKVLRGEFARDPDLARRFANEARALMLVKHPNVARAYHVARVPDGRPCIVMEYLEGATLEDRASRGPLSVAEAMPLLLQVCDGLAAAHAQGVIHRDVKPQNVLLARMSDGSEQVKLFDFGVALLLAEARTTQPGFVVGTPHYMSPEQVQGTAVDARADVYGIGVLAHRLLAGAVPFDGHTAIEVLVKQVREAPPTLAGVPANLAAVIRTAMSKRPQDRPAHAGILADALRACVSVQASAPSPDFVAHQLGPQELRLVFASEQAFQKVEREQLQHRRLFIPLDAAVATGELRLELEIVGGRRLTLVGALARRIDREEAARWNIPAGFAVALRAPAPPVRSLAPAVPVGEVRRTLERLRERAAKGHYQFLDVALDASAEEIVAAAGRLQRRLDALDPALDGELAAIAGDLRKRLDQARRALGDPQSRAWHDAVLGNFRGVARCLSAGLPSGLLEELNQKWSELHPERTSKAQSLAGVSEIHLRVRDREKALDCLQRALEIAPLDAELHRRYWGLRHDLAKGLARTG